MLESMLNARVGDDVLGDDPTVRELESRISELFGTEASVFCPTGTMSNQIALKAHTRPGDEVICDRSSHIYNFEGGGIALNSGCSVKLLNGDRGRFTAEDVEAAVNDRGNEHLAWSRVVAAENTCNKGGGSCYSFTELERIGEVCRKHGLSYHLDGARLFNAIVKNGENPVEYGRLFDSISICLSKGLGAPAGSVLTGPSEFISYARRFRKAFGGGMRQSGYLAAAGLYALDNNIERLAEDHHRAAELGATLAELPWVTGIEPVETNIIVFTVKSDIGEKRVVSDLLDAGIGMLPFGPDTIRAVTHLDFSEEDLRIVNESLLALAY